MSKYKVNRGNDDYTHVSMLPYGGSYNIPNEDLEEFYNQYNEQIRGGAKFGILERPKDIGPMLVDIDIAKKSTELETLYTKDRVLAYATTFQKQLITHTDITDHTKLECYVLEKRPYLDSKGNCKNGFHLHFPTVWMTRAHRSFITKLVKDTNIEQDYETLDDFAVRNNWFLYRSRKTETQGSYILKYSVNVDVSINPKRSRASLVRTLSIRNNITGVTNKVLETFLESPANQRVLVVTKPLNDALLTRCMEALDPSRADDYHDWIKIGCILYTIDKESGLQRWDDFSKQSYKYDEDYLHKTWSHFKDYNYSIGTLVYMAREDDEDFFTRKVPGAPADHPYTKQELLKMCKDKGLKAFTSKSVGELCYLLCLPPQEKNLRGGLKGTPKVVKLTNVETNETQSFKSVYLARRFIGRNSYNVLSRETIKSKLDDCEYRVEILN